jgi:hypothetical protein
MGRRDVTDYPSREKKIKIKRRGLATAAPLPHLCRRPTSALPLAGARPTRHPHAHASGQAEPGEAPGETPLSGSHSAPRISRISPCGPTGRGSRARRRRRGREAPPRGGCRPPGHTPATRPSHARACQSGPSPLSCAPGRAAMRWRGEGGGRVRVRLSLSRLPLFIRRGVRSGPALPAPGPCLPQCLRTSLLKPGWVDGRVGGRAGTSPEAGHRAAPLLVPALRSARAAPRPFNHHSQAAAPPGYLSSSLSRRPPTKILPFPTHTQSTLLKTLACSVSGGEVIFLSWRQGA